MSSSRTSQSFGEQYFSREILEKCLQEHYGITNQAVLARRQHYKKKVVRAYQMLCDAAQGNPFANRYLGPKSMLLIDEYNRVVETFCAHLSEIGRSPKTIDSYQRYAMRFLDHLEKYGAMGLADISVELAILHHMSRIFREQSQQQAGIRMDVDRKLRQEIRQKKIAMGHKADDHEEPTMGHTPR